MKCTACNTEFPDSAHFCPNCGLGVAQMTAAAAATPTFLSDAAETQAFVSYDPYSAGAHQHAPQDPLQTQILQPQQAEAPASPYAAAVQQPQTQAQSPYAAYGQAPTQQAPAQPQPPMQRAYGAPEPPRGYSGYGTSTQGQPMYGGQTTQSGAQQYPSYAPGAAPVSTAKRTKTPLIIAIVIIVAIVAVLGACAALGAGPFGGRTGNVGSPTAQLNPNADPIAQLDAAVKDIEGSGNFEGEFAMDMDMDMGELGKSAGMEAVSMSMDGTYSIENYDPADPSNTKMHMSMDVDTMGQSMSYVIDFAEGQATMTMNGETEKVPYSADDLTELLKDSGGLAYDSSTMNQYIKNSRIEGDTIIIELDSDFLNETLANSLAGEGLSDMDISMDTLEMRAKIGNGTVNESMDMDMTMSYMGYSIAANIDMQIKMRKK